MYTIGVLVVAPEAPVVDDEETSAITTHTTCSHTHSHAQIIKGLDSSWCIKIWIFFWAKGKKIILQKSKKKTINISPPP